MSPLRIIVIAILLYIGFRLMFGGKKKRKKDSGRPFSQADLPASDVLVEDPVCHTLVPRQQAVSWENGSQTHYFCSQECCDTFISQQGEQ